jgi:hypothetical protein
MLVYADASLSARVSLLSSMKYIISHNAASFGERETDTVGVA